MIKRTLILAAAFFTFGITALWFFAVHNATSISQTPIDGGAHASVRGAAAFESNAFGGLSLAAMETHALPWRLVSAALIMDARSSQPDLPLSAHTLNGILWKFGFLPGPDIVSVSGNAVARSRELPLGFTYGDLAPIGGSKVRVANLGCASCHAGVTYDADGTPRPGVAWLGMPNTSLNLEAYTTAVFTALKGAISDPDELLQTAASLYPDMGWRERLSLRFIVLPLAKKRISELGSAGRPLPFPNGVPGSTNGVAALKFQLGVPLHGQGPADAGIVSIPDLGDRVLRSSLLTDGSYAPPGDARQTATTPQSAGHDHLRKLAEIVTFFTVPSMGVHPENALSYVDDATDIMTFLKERYRPQKFPGSIDTILAKAGQKTFADNCASCHGTYDTSLDRPRLMEFPNWLDDVGTDPLRAAMFTDPLISGVEQTIYGARIDVVRTGKYVAPPLTGVWASAPYLHNGSVPTIADLLDPANRPKRFQLGGHRLDFERLGLNLEADGSYPQGYEPFSQPVWFDTGLAGRSNSGHEFGADLSEMEKHQLMEYLKLL